MNERREHKAHDPLTELGEVMLKAFEDEAQRREFTDARAIALVSMSGHCGIAMSNYGDDMELAVNDLIRQVRAILRTAGMDLHVVQIAKPVPGEES